MVSAGVAFRVAMLASPLHHVDGDEAVVGLMARRLLNGDVEAFFWGQDYGGIHEAVAVAGMFVLGVPTLVAMRLVPLLFAVGASLVLWRVGRRIVGEEGGRIAAALFWAAPAGMVWMSFKERGFYGATMVLGLTCVLIVLRLDEEWTRRDAALLGLAAGLGWYASPQVAYLVAPAGAWLAWRTVRRSGWRELVAHAPLVAGGLAIGVSPWLAANVARDWGSLRPPVDLPATGPLERLEVLHDRGLPVALGLQDPVLPRWIAGSLGQAAYLAIRVAAIGAVVLAMVRRPPVGRLSIVVVALATYPLIFMALPTSFTVTDPRYVSFVVPLLLLVLAWVIERRGAAVRWVVAGVVVALAAAGTGVLIDDADVDGLWEASPRDPAALVDGLRARGVDAVFADYWIAYRISLLSDQDVVASPLHPVRDLTYEAAVRRDDAPAWVLYRGTQDERWLGEYLHGRGVAFDRFDPGPFVVYLPAVRVLPEDVAPAWRQTRVARGVLPGARI